MNIDRSIKGRAAGLITPILLLFKFLKKITGVERFLEWIKK